MPAVISKYLDGRIIRRDNVSKGVLAAAVLLYGCKIGYPIVLKVCGAGGGKGDKGPDGGPRRPSGESNDNNNTKGSTATSAVSAVGGGKRSSAGKRTRAAGPGINREFLIQLKKLLRLMVPGFWTPEVGLLSMHTVALICRTFMSIFVATMEGKMVKFIVRRDVPNFGLMLLKWLLCALPATFLNSMIRYLECKLALAFSSDFDQTLSLDCNDIFEGAPLSELNISGIEPMEPSLSTLSNKSYLSQSDDLSVSSHLLNVQQVDDTENSSSEYIDTKSCLSGRRIVDIFFFIQQIQVRHSGGMDCSFIDMQFQSEKIYGFHSVFNFKCKMCGITSKIYSAENAQQKCLPINKAIISGCQAIGIGHTQMSEFAAFLEMPSLSCTGFVKLQSVVANSIHDSAWEEIRKAGEEEKRIALECGSIDSDGIPMCTVVADGQWSKRSYKTKYDALSGAVAIIGLKTQKILFIGIKNKYCVICQKSATKNEIAPKHECFMNWTKSSTSMEADGVVEGFMNSIKMHGLKYNRLIGDGDSSVTKRLNDILPYGPHFFIKKIECRNHLLRNYCSKISMLAKKTKYPLRVRKFILTNILRFRGDVTKSAKHWRNQNDLTMAQKIKGLRKDLDNCLYHRLGNHSNCAAYFCTGSKSNLAVNLIPEAENGGILREMKNCISRLVLNAESLIENKTNNICEQFNAIINKHVAGKRLNFSGRRSYNTRVEAAVISFNSNQFLRKMHKKMANNNSPGMFGNKFMKNIDRIRKNTKNKRQLFPDERRYQKPRSYGPDADYGLAEPLIEILSAEELETKKLMFLTSLNDVNFEQVEIDTRDQSNNEKWFYERKIRLTASRFGQICKMRANTSCKNTVYNILYAPSAQSKSLKYGREVEDIARKKAELIIKKKN